MIFRLPQNGLIFLFTFYKNVKFKLQVNFEGVFYTGMILEWFDIFQII